MDSDIRRLERSGERFKLYLHKRRLGQDAPDKVAEFMQPVFNSGHRSSTTETCFTVDDVAIVIGESYDRSYGTDVVGVYQLKDGRFATAAGNADETGWG